MGEEVPTFPWGDGLEEPRDGGLDLLEHRAGAGGAANNPASPGRLRHQRVNPSNSFLAQAITALLDCPE